MDAEVSQIKMDRFEELKHRRVIMIVFDDYGFRVEDWSPTGVAPVSGYDTPHEAAARILQLLKIEEPITPQNWPEIARIGG